MEKQSIFIALLLIIYFTKASCRQTDYKTYNEHLIVSILNVFETQNHKFLHDLGYQCTNIGWHKFSPVPMSWKDAKSLCEKDGAHLAVVNTEEEAEILGNMIKNARPLMTGTGYDESAYIGIHDQYTEGNWITIFNNSLQEAGYERWQIGSPDNMYFTRNGEEKPANCGLLHYKRYFIDAYCDMEYAFLCEYPSGPKCYNPQFYKY